jgi:squid-like protein/heterogeneous nuclear ribonucleoprotein A1/A3
MSTVRTRIELWWAALASPAAVSVPATSVRAVAACAVALWLAGCAVTGVGVGYDGGDDYVGGFYEPYGYDYGGWGGGYGVGPRWGDRGRGDGRGGNHGTDGRGGDHRPGPGPGHGQGAGGGRPFHGAPPSRGMPSIPHSPRSR